MNSYKNTVASRFNRASYTYDSVASVQYKTALKLVNILVKELPLFYPTEVLDVGAGTGNASLILSQFYRQATFTLNDISRQMLKVACQKLLQEGVSQVNLLPEDIEEWAKLDNFNQTKVEAIQTSNISPYSNIFKANYDLIISNFSFQWFKRPAETIKHLFNKTHCLAFTSLVEGSLEEYFTFVEQLLVANQVANNNWQPFKYLTASQLNNIVSNLGGELVHFSVEDFWLEFKNIGFFLKYIKKLGANVSGYNLPPKVLKSLLLNPQRFFTKYKVAFVLVSKRGNN